MVPTMKWFDRQFSFDQPAWIFPNIVERLRGTPARAEDLTRSTGVTALTAPDGNRWSIQKNIGHLLDLEPLWQGRLDDFLQERTRLREADLTNLKTHETDHDAVSLSAILAAFRSERMRLVAQLDGLEHDLVERTALHPRLGQPMRLLDLAFFIAEHDDHHLAQIRSLQRPFDKSF